MSDIASVLAAIGGATVVRLFPKDDGSFSCYSIGLVVGFFGYLLVSWMASSTARRCAARDLDELLGRRINCRSLTEASDTKTPTYEDMKSFWWAAFNFYRHLRHPEYKDRVGELDKLRPYPVMKAVLATP